MAFPGDLVTLAQALAWLGQTADTNNIIAGLVSSVSTQIQNFVGYQLASANYTRSFNGTGTQRLSLPDRPVTAVASLTIDTISIPAASGLTPGYVFDSKFLYLRGYNRWPRGFDIVGTFQRGFQNVAVAYTAGYATIPFDIQQACLNWLSSAYALLGEDPTVKMLRAGDTQINFDFVATKIEDATILLPPAIASALMPYRRIAT